ncbi:hypothetical protein [Amycolatopsis sp. NPDC051372]|uniref:hypothetical protein n=1 Tax=Amycolatopsis sp. NPDC051372 TaxID=3155669 RepID=UPI00343AD38A
MVFVAFDLLGSRGHDLRTLPYSRRRERLEAVIGAGNAGVQLMRSTSSWRAWISAEQAAVGVAGSLAKPLGSRYPLRGGRAGWVKVRHVDDVDALVLGVTGSPTRPTALVLGQTDRRAGAGGGALDHAVAAGARVPRGQTPARARRLRASLRSRGRPARQRRLHLLAGRTRRHRRGTRGLRIRARPPPTSAPRGQGETLHHQALSPRSGVRRCLTAFQGGNGGPDSLFFFVSG